MPRALHLLYTRPLTIPFARSMICRHRSSLQGIRATAAPSSHALEGSVSTLSSELERVHLPPPKEGGTSASARMRQGGSLGLPAELDHHVPPLIQTHMCARWDKRGGVVVLDDERAGEGIGREL